MGPSRKPGGIMKAIIFIDGDRISLAGYGKDEAAARRAAFQNVNNGYNQYDEELPDGQAIEISARLVELQQRAENWINTYEEDGTLVGVEAPEAHFELLHAYASLRIKDGKLDYDIKK